MKNVLPVMTVLVRRQLGWGPDVALGQVGRMFGQFLISQGCCAFQQILICRPPCTSQFVILISSSNSAQMLTCKFLNSSKSQSETLNYQILDCRVLCGHRLLQQQQYEYLLDFRHNYGCNNCCCCCCGCGCGCCCCCCCRCCCSCSHINSSLQCSPWLQDRLQ